MIKGVMPPGLIGIDLFCGVGGLSLGFERSGIEVVAAADLSDLTVQAHHRNFPKCRTIKADLTTMTGSEFRQQAGLGDRSIDVVFGGPPCQGFSFGGTHKRGDPRNRLVMRFARLVSELCPSYFVMENVRGLLSPDHRALLQRFRRRLKSAGYLVVTPIKALNARDFGVPQHRSRVFILGYREGLNPPAYPEPLAAPHPTVWDAIGDLTIADDHPCCRMGDLYWGPVGLPSSYAVALGARAPAPLDPLTGFAQTMHSKKISRRFRSAKPGTRDPVSRFHKLKKSGLCSTLRAGTGPENGSFMAPRPIHPFRPRCIYTREAARLHSFPDWFQFDETLWHAFRQIGNSVPPLLAQALAASIVAAASASKELLKAS